MSGCVGPWDDGNYPSNADVRVFNDAAAAVQIQHCTESCKSRDLEERQSVPVGSTATLNVNGDPHFTEPYIVTLPDGHVACLLADAATPNMVVSDARPVARSSDCHERYLDHPTGG